MPASKIKPIKKKNQRQKSEKRTIKAIRDKKINKSKTQYLLEFDDLPDSKDYKWVNESELDQYSQAEEQLKNYNIQNSQSEKGEKKKIEVKPKVEEEAEEKKFSNSLIKKINIQSSSILNKLKGTQHKQGLLDKFINKMQDQKQSQQKRTQSKADLTSLKDKLIRVKKEESIIKKVPEIPHKKSIPNYLERISKVKKIKGFTIQNGKILYQAEVSDKNGQNLFVPPLPSQTIRSIDESQLTKFLQSCIIRGADQDIKVK